MTLDFFVTAMIVVLLPGTGVLYTLAIGLGQGMRASIAAAFGCTLGIVPHALASLVGLAALLHTSALVFQIVKYLGALYLLYMAWSVLREHGPLSISQERSAVNWRRTISAGIALNILNPKLSLFFLAFLPQFVSPHTQNATVHLSILAIVFMLMTFIVFVGYGLCAALVRDTLLARPRVLLWLRRSFAGAFAVLGLKLALSER